MQTVIKKINSKKWHGSRGGIQKRRGYAVKSTELGKSLGGEGVDNRETSRCGKMLMLLAWVKPKLTCATELGKEELQVLGEKH